MFCFIHFPIKLIFFISLLRLHSANQCISHNQLNHCLSTLVQSTFVLIAVQVSEEREREHEGERNAVFVLVKESRVFGIC
jgi:hypothetical protein